MKIQLKSYMLLVFFSLAITFNTYAAEITVGDANLNIQPFSGFSEISSASNETFEMFQDICPSTNRLLAVFLTQDDASKIFLGELAILDRYIIVQSSKELETLTLTKYQFKEIRTTMREQYDSQIKKQDESIGQISEKASDVLSKRLNSEILLKLGGVIFLGIHSETASSITLSQLTKYSMKINGEDVESVIASAVTTLLVKGKVIYLYVFKQYHTEEDIEWVCTTAKEYSEQILSANNTAWPIATGTIVPKGTMVDSITKELLAGDYVEYSLKSHPKALGLDVVLKHPQSWKATEGNRPHIVQVFTGERISSLAPSCLVGVQKMPFWAGLFIKGEIAEDVLEESLQDFIPTGGIFIDSGKTKIDGEPCAWLKYYYESERVGIKVGMYVLQYILFYDSKMLMVQCSVGGKNEDRNILEDAFNSYLPVFQMIGNSIVITEKWTNPNRTAKSEDSIMENAFGEYWFLSLLLSAILTWGIGLAPPLLIRYAILRKPLSKKVAIPIVILFWLINIVIFTGLGSQSKTHAALFLVAWVSYYILHKGYSIWLREDKDDDTVKSVSNAEQVEKNTAPDKLPPKPESEFIMSNRLVKCSNCKRTIGKLEHFYMIEGNTVCVKCYQILNPESS